MTSEVLVLNKHAVVLGADSAVTTTPARDGEHPRYSKTANKLFELSDQGNVAVMIYGGAHIDLVPWEIAIKIYRSDLGSSKFPSIDLYLEQLLTFLRSNGQLFGVTLLTELMTLRFDLGMKEVLKRALHHDKSIFDKNSALAARKASWHDYFSITDQILTAKGMHKSLSAADMASELGSASNRAAGVVTLLSKEPELEAIDAMELTTLAIKVLFSSGNEFLPSTGLVVAGYGDQDIFPGYRKVEVYGHIGSQLLYDDAENFHVTHIESSMIKGWAQTSMIDVFTDGFGFPLYKIINTQSRDGLHALVKELQLKGITLSQAETDSVIDKVHSAFMSAWIRENYEENWQPLRSVLSSLGVQEMVHLAETLLTLQAVKERVTSSSESVGGPIDVAAITKAEGLVWLKRKHYFDPELNARYISRLHHRLA